MKGREETTTPKAETASFENPADAAVLAEIAAAQASGGDPFGDHDDDSAADAGAPAPAPEPSPPAPAPAAADAAETGDLDDTQPPAPAPAPAAAAAPAPTPAPAEAPAAQAEPSQAPAPTLQFKTRKAEEIAAEQSQMLAKKADAFKKYSDGTMSPEDYMAVDNEVTQAMLRIGTESALAAASQQSVLIQQESVIDGIKRQAKQAGQLDYDADPAAQAQFNAALELVARDPKAGTMTDAEFYGKAHTLVLFQRGITGAAAPAAPAPGPAPARQDMRPTVPTLRDVPAAAVPNAGGGLTEQLSRLNGLDFEEAVANLPRSQRDQWLDS